MPKLTSKLIFIFLCVITTPSYSNGVENSCDDCYEVTGIFKSMTKLDLGGDNKLLTVIELQDGKVFISDHPKVLVGPVGSELKIVASKSIVLLPSHAKSLYPDAITAKSIEVLSMPLGVGDIKMELK